MEKKSLISENRTLNQIQKRNLKNYKIMFWEIKKFNF